MPFDRVADIYDKTRALPPDIMEKVLDAMERTLSSGKRTIEVGVGTGRFAIPLQRRGVDVLGIDISRAMLAKARAKGGGDVMLADALEMPFRDGAFENAIAIHVLHLVNDLP